MPWKLAPLGFALSLKVKACSTIRVRALSEVRRLLFKKQNGEEIWTAFYCSLVARTTGRGQESRLPAINAGYTGPDAINMFYGKCLPSGRPLRGVSANSTRNADRSSLERARESSSTSTSVAPDVASASASAPALASGSVVARELGPFLMAHPLFHWLGWFITGFNLLLLGLYSADYTWSKENFRALLTGPWPYVVGYVMLLIPHTAAVLTLKSWAFRRRVANASWAPVVRTAWSHLLRWAEIAVDYEVNSRFVSTMVYWLPGMLVPLVIQLAVKNSMAALVYCFTLPSSIILRVQMDLGGTIQAFRREADYELAIHYLWETANTDPVLSDRGKFIIGQLQGIGAWNGFGAVRAGS